MSQRIHLARLPRFQLPGIPGSKVILLRTSTKFYQILTSSLLVRKCKVSSTQLSGQVNTYEKSINRQKTCALERVSMLLCYCNVDL